MKSRLSFKLKKPNQRKAKFGIIPTELLQEWDEDMDGFGEVKLSDDEWIWFYSPAIIEWRQFDHKLIRMY